ncbi:hypothetical protein A499_09649 [Niallia nealsonii AAU1]|nr:hypothetical protein A499_09649 [Niallia nealsonii AAU1]
MFVKFADKGINNQKSVFPIRKAAILNTAKYICYAIPVLFLAYIYLAAIQTNVPFLQYIEQNPFITILFVIAMIQPFVSLAIGLGMRSFVKHSPFVLWSFIILAAAELLMGNILVCVLIIWGLISFRKQSSNRKNRADEISRRNSIYLFFGLSAFLFFLSIICIWAFLRISGI